MRLSRTDVIIALVMLTLLGYWFNLGVVSYSAVGNNELRLYDLTFLGLIPLYLSEKNKRGVFSSNKGLKYFQTFAIWVTITLIFTFFHMYAVNRITAFFQAVLYVFHLWGFYVTAYYVFAYYQKGNFRKKMAYLFLGLNFVEAVIILAQLTGNLGTFWSEAYVESYGIASPSGTLGPNRIVPGIMSVFGFAFCVFSWNYLTGILKRWALILIYGGLLLNTLVIVLLGSKTALISFAIFLVLLLFIYGSKKLYLSVVLLAVFSGFYVFLFGVPQGLTQRYEDVLISRRLNQIDLSGQSITEIYDEQGAGRSELMIKYINLTFDQPWYIPFGSGVFNLEVKKGSSAHNIYLSLINELGIVGLVLYLRWLLSGIFIERRLSALSDNRKGKILAPLILCMVVSLWAGEHLYIYRPVFAILGTFLLIVNFITANYQLINEQDAQ